MRLILLTLLTQLTLTACLKLPLQQPEHETVQKQNPDMLLFIEGVDQFDSDQRSEAFLALQKQYPDSSWNRRAKVLARMAGSIRLQEKQIKRQEGLLDGQKNSHLALLDLNQENKRLQKQIKVLKALIVDLELRQP